MKNYKRPLGWAAAYLCMIIVFAIFYLFVPDKWGGLEPINGFVDSFYFSVVTITSLGFGDTYPVSGSSVRILVATEAILGILIIGFFLNDIALSQSKLLDKRNKEKEEQKRRETAVRKLNLWFGEIEPVIKRYLYGVYELITPDSKRKYLDDYINYEYQFEFCDLCDMYGHSRLMINSHFEPVVNIYFRNEDRLYDALMSFVSIADLEYWPDLEQKIYHYMRLHQGFHFKDVIISNENVGLGDGGKLVDSLSKTIKETEGVPEYRSRANLLNDYIALYHYVKELIKTVKDIHTMMSVVKYD